MIEDQWLSGAFLPFSTERHPLQTSELEELLRIHPLLGLEDHWAGSVLDTLPLLTASGITYVLVGTIAMGIHARPRFTRTIQLVLSGAPPDDWLNAIRSAGYLEHLDLQEAGCSSWQRQHTKLTISISSSSASRSAIDHADSYRLLGSGIRVAKPQYLLWLYLEAGDRPDSISEGIELITYCPKAFSELRAELPSEHDHLITVLDSWGESALRARSSNYSERVVARLRLRARRSLG